MSLTTLVLLTTALALAAAERLPALRFAPLPLLRPLVASDLLYLATGFVAGASLALAYVVTLAHAVGELGLPRVAALDLPLWIAAPACLVLLDLGNYGAHVALHRFAPLWEIHKVHHSIRTLDWLTTFRSHLLEQAFRRLVAPLALIVVGAPLPAIVVAASVFNAWAMLNHANLAIDLRMLEPVLITPRLHRLHHLPQTTDRNLGTLLSVWDRLRGRLVRRDASPQERCGVPGELDDYPQGWWRQLIAPLGAVARIVATNKNAPGARLPGRAS